uniref:Si:dkey-56d12.4 n=1 Tax=Iconisemion striatum TaxID=60296 RepID=A0A1A7WTB6_9TELE
MVPKADPDDLRQKSSQLQTECDNLHVDINKLKAENEELKTLTGVEVVGRSLALEDHLLVVLVKLRLGLINKDIAFRFHVTECDVSNVLRSWLPVTSQV